MIDARLFIAIPCHRQMEADTALALGCMMHRLGQLQANGQIESTTLSIRGDSILPRSRHNMVVKALELNATHILWVDADMIFPPTSAEMLLRWETPIVGCNCVRRTRPYLPTAKGKEFENVWTTPEKVERGGIESVNGMGFGVTLIETRVYREIDMPWFRVEWLPEKNHWLGEDVAFFLKAIDAGFQPYIDHELSWHIKHIGELRCDWPLAMLEKQEVEKVEAEAKAAAEQADADA
jgi:hypothetical protein